MAQSNQNTGKKLPAFIIRHYPEREGSKSTRIGAMWKNEANAGYSAVIEYLPLEALLMGKLNLSIWPYEPKQDDAA
jgi:hypothetical protein